MKYRSARGFSGWAQTGILVAFVGAGLIIAGVIQLGIGFSLINANIPLAQKGDAMLKALFKPENTAWLQLSQVISTLFLMFMPTAIYSLICNGNNPLWLGFSRYINLWQIIVAFFIIYCANVVAQPFQDLSKRIIAHFPHFNKWAQGLEDTYNQEVLAMSSLKSWRSLVLAIITIAFFPALFEEVLFRGGIQNLFIRWWKKPLFGIIITSVIFSFIHGEAYPFLSRVILGFALGMIYWQSKNLWVNIIAHFLNNAFFLVQLFIETHGSKPDLSKLDDHFPLWLALISIIAFYFLFMVFKKISAKNRSKIEMDETRMWIKATAQYNLADTKDPFK